jgi:hypothetical protein
VLTKVLIMCSDPEISGLGIDVSKKKHARLFLKSTRLRFKVGWTDEVESA